MVKVNNFELCIKGCIFKFDGYLIVNMLGVKKLDEDIELLDVVVGEILDLKKLDLS